MSHWRTSSASRATDTQPAGRCGANLSIGVVDVVLLVFAGVLVVLIIFVVVLAFDDQRVILVLILRAFILIFVFVLEIFVLIFTFVFFVGCGCGMLLVEEVEIFKSQIAGGLHGASPW
ncbi:MAG TPA: hypothetical protein VN612_09405 [Acidobacteriaceae bacterium]|nr:hypothetical protein [Acidobacteriaceae bacterium]